MYRDNISLSAVEIQARVADRRLLVDSSYCEVKFICQIRRAEFLHVAIFRKERRRKKTEHLACVRVTVDEWLGGKQCGQNTQKVPVSSFFLFIFYSANWIERDYRLHIRWSPPSTGIARCYPGLRGASTTATPSQGYRDLSCWHPVRDRERETNDWVNWTRRKYRASDFRACEGLTHFCLVFGIWQCSRNSCWKSRPLAEKRTGVSLRSVSDHGVSRAIFSSQRYMRN